MQIFFQGILTEGEVSVQLTSLYQLNLGQHIKKIIFTLVTTQAT